MYSNTFTKTVDVKIPRFSAEKTRLYNELIEVLIINMYGEAQREGGIYIDVFNPNNAPSRVVMYAALKVASLFQTDIYIKCGVWKYLKTKNKYNELFKKQQFIHRTNKSGRPVYKWLGDISNARHLDYDIWFDVWEYLDEI